ncbi:MAG: hypothetical protein O3C40_33750 [Planctomycetota bacterium]|nr:hypothetical protein [Planctomycetota bacterium]
MTSKVAIHRCPSDIGGELNPSRTSSFVGASTISNYIAANSAFDVEVFPRGVQAHQGLFGADEALAFQDVRGGSSNRLIGREINHQWADAQRAPK